jgi:hypothetical protein
MTVRARTGGVYLDFSRAVLRYPVIEIEVDIAWTGRVRWGSLRVRQRR